MKSLFTRQATSLARARSVASVALLLLSLCCLGVGAKAQTWGTPEWTEAGGTLGSEYAYVRVANTVTAYYGDGYDETFYYNTEVTLDIITITATFYDNHHNIISNATATVGSSSTYPNDYVTDNWSSAEFFGGVMNFSGTAYCTPPTGYTHWGDWLEAVAPDDFYHYIVTLSVQATEDCICLSPGSGNECNLDTNTALEMFGE